MAGRIELIRGDITKIEVDAIVNAANASLMGGAGVDGAIHRAGGPAILEECRMIVARQESCKTGEAVITTAGNLPSSYIIHTVGPVWNGGTKDEAAKLSDCYTNCIRLAAANNIRSIAFPNISTGIYGYPKKEAAFIAIETVSKLLPAYTRITRLLFICFDEENFLIYKSMLNG